MNEDEAYLEVANRYIESCQKHLENGINIQEVLGFKSYHAFESVGGAFNSHFGHNIPKSHAKKINLFVRTSQHNRHVNPRVIASLAMTLNSMRNRYLYPLKFGTTFETPQNQISLTDARRLVSRINGLIRRIERLI